MTEPSPGLKIATLRGVPIYIGRSWPIVAVMLVALFGPQVARLHPEWGLGAYAFALGYAVLLLVSVLVHEAAHAVTGQLCGYRVGRIVADLWGGHTSYDTPDATPGRSALVAGVGPVSNALMAALGWLALHQVDGEGAGTLLLIAFTWSNAFVACFNALPGLPLDGGFVVDALVWKLTGNRATGMKAAGWCGRALAIVVAGYAVLQLTGGGGFGSAWSFVWFLLIAGFLWRGASTAVTVGNNREFLGGITTDTVLRPALAVAETTPVAHLPESAEPVVLLDSGGTPVAVVPPGAHVRVPVGQREHVPASALGEALAPGAHAVLTSPHEDIISVLPAFEGDPTPSVAVVTSPDGAVVGIVLLSDLQRALERRAATR